ncbi:MAG: hypothetical protein H6Q48_3958 [Deltaproteobacteria bacterium]|nr:hypothetical protein [Deltaproteobacteria bacterium]
MFVEKDEKPEVNSIFIDNEGRWFYQGLEMVRRDIVLLFYRHLHLDGQGQYLIRLGGEERYLGVEDTAFVVSRIDLEPHGDGGAIFRIWLNDDSQEVLNLDTLFVGKGNVLYCRVKEGRFPARFRRQAYYQLAEHVQEESGQYLVSLNGKSHVIRQDV